MPSYQVTLSEGGSPNCAGVYEEHIEYNGQMSYRCVNDAGTWYLTWNSQLPNRWKIGPIPGTQDDLGMARWDSAAMPKGGTPLNVLVGAYAPALITGATGTATVAEYVPPASDPALRGKLFLLISHVNGVELASPKKISLVEFDE